MRKVLPILGASLSALAMAWAAPSQAQDQAAFKDLDPNHWAYQAVNELQAKGVLEGYPDGYFRGKRTLTRYEFAIALKRLLVKIPMGGGEGTKGDQGEQGPPGPAGAQGPTGVTPEELANIRRLAEEFRSELTSLGADVRNIRSRLDRMQGELNAVKERLDKMPVIGGNFFVGVRGDRSRFGYLDYSGAARAANNGSIVGGTGLDTPHDFHLTVDANLPNAMRFRGDLVSSNYLGYQPLGGAALAAKNPNPQQTSLYQAALDIPIGGFGSDTVLTVGRYKHQVTPLTYFRPDTDAYFDLPWYDDGNWVQDGVRLQSKFGSATTSIFGGSYTNLTTNAGGINRPFVGAAANMPLVGGPTIKPFGLSNTGPGGFNVQGTGAAAQVIGLHVGIPLFRFGEFGATLIDFSAAGAGFGNVMLYGGNFKLNPMGRFNISGEWAKTVQQATFTRGSGLGNNDNNAFNLNLAWGSGPASVQAGYQYVDPLFMAPGYWNKIGNWINPTNIRGPFVRLGWKFSDSVMLNFGGDYYEGARNRPGFAVSDKIYRANAGVKWNLNKTVTLGADYEGVFWDLTAATAAGPTRARPIEQYITLGAGLNLNSNTVLRLMYQMINAQDVGNGFGLAGTGLAGGGNSYNAGVFTTQVAVKF